jgi:hypothetical protein
VWQIIKVDFMTAIGWVMQGDVSKLHLHNSGIHHSHTQDGRSGGSKGLSPHKLDTQLREDHHQGIG